VNIFTKPLKYDIFVKMRDLLGVIKKSSLKRGVESKPDFKELIGLIDQLGIDQPIGT